MTRKELIRQINNNYFEMTLRYAEDEDWVIFAETRERLAKISGASVLSKGLNKGDISRLNKVKLNAYLKVQQDFLRSSWSSEEGRNRIIANSYNQFHKYNVGVSKKNFLKIIEIIGSGAFQRIRELKNIPSKLIVRLSKKYGYNEVDLALQALLTESGLDLSSPDLPEQDAENWLVNWLNNRSNGYVR